MKSAEVKKERFYIGRRPHNDLQILNMNISGEHCYIMKVQCQQKGTVQCYLHDTSSNGTFVNGKQASRQKCLPSQISKGQAIELKNGDQVHLLPPDQV